ncbi:DUF1080 domain-containing protein [candidate division KSB1 bacterium]|nr:DUF1080 domain-containing protein [candidate division KSB1 bacterium]
MNSRTIIVVILGFLVLSATLLLAQDDAEDNLPKPEETEFWEPVPPVVTPGLNTAPPSDAIVLFNGTDFSSWEPTKGDTIKWILEDGTMTVGKKAGDIKTKQGFDDCQLHVEFRTPRKVVGKSQGRGNSGIFLQEHYEVQILDCYDNATYVNGMIGSIYKQYVPLVNACRKPGEWQTYDIIFTAPRFDMDGSVLKPAYFTVFLNGILVQYHVEVKGNTVWRGQPFYKKHGFKESIRLQDHNNPTSFRNIWIREL